MVFEHKVLSEHAAEDRRRLVDDRCERNAVDDAVHAVGFGMIKRETQRGERLATSRRHVQRKGAARQDGFAADTRKTQEEAIAWAKQNGHTPLVARVRHLNDKKKPDRWRSA
jgi:hypothetical protein